MRTLYLIGIPALCVSGWVHPAWGGEVAILSNGMRMRADRHEPDGALLKLYSGGGYTEIPAAMVASFEQEPDASLPPKTAAPPTPPAPAAPADPVTEAAKKYNLPEAFVRGVMRAESGGNPNALSPKGAIGLMQLMPDTARDLGVDPKNPEENADGGTQYLRDLLARYENDPDQVLLAL
ncbi:MAG: lytic transglycosylase domain-containing protein, partial [Acidobacteriota bacterium]|nr:lytic transglycosylase domain-containing protein [Acidobacteriota bacterium]